ncbi:hypothetical protein MRB53_017149 [Persea americana]|uniref:Uncharacterized protein n=1 Tax=Persea americana TaxID=3435 RepID=A0ACC2M4B7_PERAE|nr:hypothetical protein MRB53_017149 [Persea americana]
MPLFQVEAEPQFYDKNAPDGNSFGNESPLMKPVLVLCNLKLPSVLILSQCERGLKEQTREEETDTGLGFKSNEEEPSAAVWEDDVCVTACSGIYVHVGNDLFGALYGGGAW